MDICGISLDSFEAFMKTINPEETDIWFDRMVNAFEIADNPNERNKLAILLSDFGKELAIIPIIKMIKDPRTKGNRGTLLYALEELDCSLYLDFLFSLMIEDNFEVSRQAYLIIEKVLSKENNNLELIKKQIPLLTEKVRTLQADVDFYLSALELLSK
jgi:hypothetical protein